MKFSRSIFILTLLWLLPPGALANSTRHVIWNKIPITVNLPIGSEKIITFPNTIKPYLPTDLIANGELTSINNNGTLYLTARNAFSPQIAEVKLNNKSGDVILLNLSATKTANQDQLSVILHKESTTTSISSSVTNNDQSIGDMVRWVSQELYVPKRLLTKPNWIYRTPMQTEQFVPLYRGAIVSSMPLASWRAGNYYITAVLLRNILKKKRVHLSNKMIRGNWVALCFFRLTKFNPAILTPARTFTDTTTAILVSNLPFREALNQGFDDV